MPKLIVITPLFSVTWSFRHLICWFSAQETFIHIINAENSLAAKYFDHDTYLLRILWWKFKRTTFIMHLLYIIIIFTVTFDTFNASLLNTIISE